MEEMYDDLVTKLKDVFGEDGSLALEYGYDEPIDFDQVQQAYEKDVESVFW